jgi:hypothetical protein
VFAHRVSGQIDLVGAVDEAIEDGVGEGRIAEVVMPKGDRKLAGDQGGARLDAVVEDFEQIAPLLVVQRGQSPVIQDQQLGARQFGEQLGVTPLGAGHRQILQQPGKAQVAHGEAVATGLVGQGARDPPFFRRRSAR